LAPILFKIQILPSISPVWSGPADENTTKKNWRAFRLERIAPADEKCLKNRRAFRLALNKNWRAFCAVFSRSGGCIYIYAYPVLASIASRTPDKLLKLYMCDIYKSIY